ncbi:hypothetical protein TCAL_12997 [Tigriopus californicus]|uniref:BHLH domain-containing protein n=1 Tax=Tigriopus californicus TaxID=6832 RepID=A0A553PER8_TIGCA|nr:basic helix-loop-helix transcription factor scleraxis-like [Tigriopus californicus]TRY76166.1 hypothetical protein TCAL_12997 [Tigriopus californicus]
MDHDWINPCLNSIEHHCNNYEQIHHENKGSAYNYDPHLELEKPVESGNLLYQELTVSTNKPHINHGSVPCSDHKRLTREEKRRRRRSSLKYRTAHATRERIRVEAFNSSFQNLRTLLPTLPPDKKLSKIEILRLAICYITYLNSVLYPESQQ